MTDFLQYIGAITGMIGALLMALNIPASRFAYVAYLASTIAWLVYGWMSDIPGLVLMQSVFFVTTLIGLWKWFPRTSLKRAGGELLKESDRVRQPS
jgi:hypothetical protein